MDSLILRRIGWFWLRAMLSQLHMPIPMIKSVELCTTSAEYGIFRNSKRYETIGIRSRMRRRSVPGRGCAIGPSTIFNPIRFSRWSPKLMRASLWGFFRFIATDLSSAAELYGFLALVRFAAIIKVCLRRLNIVLGSLQQSQDVYRRHRKMRQIVGIRLNWTTFMTTIWPSRSLSARCRCEGTNCSR